MALAAQGLNNAKPYKWEYDDLTAANASTEVTAADIGTLARFDDNTLWMLTDDSPVTWVQQTSAGTSILATIVDAKGDIIAATANDTPARLAVGANGKVLKANSATSTGLEWADEQTITPVVDFKESVRAATTANITLSGAQTIDGVSVIAGDRVLVKAQSTGADNGIYVAAAGAWARSTDADTSAEVTAGMAVPVAEGTTNADTLWLLSTNDPITLGTTALTFTQLGSSGSGAPTTAEYVTTASDGTLSAEVVIPGLRGNINRKGILDGETAAGGISEEYDTTTTGLTWSPSTPDTVNSHTTHKSHLYVKTLSNTEYLGTRSWSPAGALDARAHISGGIDVNANFSPSIGLHIGNSGNTSRVLLHLQNNIGTGGVSDGMAVRAFTYASGSYTGLGAGATNIGLNSVYVRITRDGSNNWTFYVSDNGLTWIRLASASLTFTVANIGYRINPGTASAGYYVSDWLRTDV